MISIVMAYRNRRQLLINTLNTIRLSEIKDIEVIITDDCSDEAERIEDLKYPFPIKVIRIDPKDKWYFNPCIPYNLAMKEAKGEIVVIQNPECMYTCDILADVVKRITNDNYLAYAVYSLNKETTEKLQHLTYDKSIYTKLLNSVTFKDRGDVRVDGWFNHSHWRPAGFHFLTALTNDNLKRIGYFDERFATGVDYDDMEFRDRATKNLKIQYVDDKIVFHQYHDLIAYNYPNLESLRVRNKQLYNEIRYPKITIFTSSYNYSKYLRKAIDSVLSQTYRNFEYLLFDAGSTDDTLEIMQSYKDDRIKVTHIDEPLNTGQLINKSVEMATGKYWVWCPADDYFDPTLLETKLRYTDRYPESVLYDNFHYLNDIGEVIGKCDLKEIPADEFSRVIWDTCPIGFTGIMIPVKHLKAIPFPEHMVINEDYYWILKAINQGVDFNLVPFGLHYKRQHGSSLSATKIEQTAKNVKMIRNELRQKNILVTGGAGFIGSNLVSELVKAGNNVTVLDNLSSGYKDNIIEGVNFIEGDVRDYQTVEKTMKGVEVVFHLAASVGNKRSIDNPVQDAMINAIGTLNVLETAQKEGVKKIIVSSSAGIFGELKTIPISEGHPCEPDSPYGCSKLYEEKIALAYGKLYGMQVVCLRYFNVYGQNQRFDEYGNVIPIFVKRMLKGEPLIIYGDGEQTRDFVHVDDVVQANLKASYSDAVGAFNIASGSRININQLAGWISSDIEHTNERPGDVRDSLADITLARAAFGYEPVIELETGIKDYIKWAEKSF